MTNTPTTDVESPFNIDQPAYVDMLKHTGLAEYDNDVVRVELRRAKEKVTEDAAPARTVEDSYVIGIIKRVALPKPGAVFEMAYHALSSAAGFGSSRVQDYGQVSTISPIDGLVIEGNSYYFKTSEGPWRLMILDIGN